MNQASLAQLIDRAPLVVCLGPGGVGKTTLSAIIALRQAAFGRRALVLTIDPARRLADALNVTGLTNDPVEVGSFRKLHPGGSLSALMLDPTSTFDHMISLLVADPDRRAALFSNRFYQHLSRSLSGTLEYMAVERLHELTATAGFERIVLDTPPTTNALDFLEAPDRLADFFSEKITRWFMPSAGEQAPSWTARLFSRAGSTALGLLTRVAGESFVEDTVGFFAAFADIFGHVRSRGVAVGKLLRDPSTLFLIVCSPDSNRLAEAIEIDRRLAQAGCKAGAFVVNRVDEPFLPEPADFEQAVERTTLLSGAEGDSERVRAFLDRLEKTRKVHESAAAARARALEELRQHARSRPVFAAPRVPGGQSPRAALLALYVGLFSEEAPRVEQARERREGDSP